MCGKIDHYESVTEFLQSRLGMDEAETLEARDALTIAWRKEMKKIGRKRSDDA